MLAGKSQSLTTHLRVLNDGFILTPLHKMALMCLDTIEADVDGHATSFNERCAQLMTD
jgi:glutamate-1-semialdehyde 2,1-aminomutase